MKLTMTRGNNKTFNVAVTVGGLPYSLAGTQLFFTTKKSPEDSAYVFRKSIGSGITVTNEAAGLATIELVPADTTALPSLTTSLYYDLEVEKASKIYTLTSGRLVVDPDITVR